MVPIGTILDDRYEILEHIGTGGMADVYKARCHKTGSYVAVKVLRREYNEDEAFVRRFQAEAQATSGLTHPNIVSIFDVGHDKDIYYIVMELAQGMTLKKYIRRYGRLSVRETVDFAMQIASGIRAAHDHKIIHRDIKPQNIMVSDSGKIMVTDFGIARVATGETTTGNAMGSVRYLSPEQARGGYSDERSDIYSLGITIYEMATGKVPFDGDNSVTIALKHLQEEMTPPRCYFPDIPVSLEKIILKCCMKQPSRRYQNVSELIGDLSKVFECPDGNYIYMETQDDDSPTVVRTREELDEIKNSVITEEVPDEDADVKVAKGKEDPLFEKKNPKELTEEDEDDDDDMKSSMQKVIITISIAVGVLIACIVVYMVVSMMHLIPSGNKTDDSSTAAQSSTGTTAVKTVKMPDLEKFTKAEAEEKCNEYSIKVLFLYDSDVGVDQQNDESLIVLAQSIDKGTTIPRGSTVELLLGWNPDATTETTQLEVPPLVNYTEEDAVDLLESMGFKVQRAYSTSDTVAEGYVIKQSPLAGTLVEEGFTVTITISQGYEQCRVPNLSGLSQKAAEAELTRVGLVLGSVTSDYSGEVGIGDVISQSIDSGVYVDKGTAVSIVVSLGEQETFTYRGEVAVTDCPFMEGETGSVSLELEQNGETKTIFNQDGVSAESFPLDISFEGFAEGDATVVMYVNGSEYTRYDVYLSAIAD